MQSGVFISSDLLARTDIGGALFADESQKRIIFAFCDDFFVRTFLTEDEKSPAKIRLLEDTVMLQSERALVEVDVVSPPQFLRLRQNNRDPVSHNIDLDGNCLNLFLRILKKSRLNVSIENSINLIQSAFEEGVADLVQLNLDFYDADDRGFFKLIPLIQDIRKKFSTFIALRGFPPKNLRVIDSIYASGVDLLNFPLEGFARAEKLETISPQILESLEYAVSVFPQGAISTELVLGPVGPLKDVIDRLASKGIIPQVRLPQSMRQDPSRLPALIEIAKHLTATAYNHKLNLKWLYPTADFVTPLDASFFTEDPKTAHLAVRPHYHTILGRKTSEGFTALRRRLRVKNISDSYESAGL